MIDVNLANDKIEKAKKEYLKYTSNYEMSIYDLKRRVEHSFRVMDISKQIAESLNLDSEKVDLAMLIGLLHDIGRYEEYMKKYIYKSDEKIDHGDLGIEILKNNNYIRNFILEEDYDNIILKAIEFHNKYSITEDLKEEEILFAKIIRDADKLDIFYECWENFWIDIKDVESSCISEEVLKDFKENIVISKKIIKTPIDNLLMVLAFIFDINFEYSFEIIKKEKYIEKIIGIFNFEKNKTAMKQLEEVKKILNEYIQKK